MLLYAIPRLAGVKGVCADCKRDGQPAVTLDDVSDFMKKLGSTSEQVLAIARKQLALAKETAS
jgi:hypothetical protein